MSQLTYGLFAHKTVNPMRKGKILLIIIYSVPNCTYGSYPLPIYLMNE